MTLQLDGGVALGSFIMQTNITAQNEVIAISGANGVGKTTVMRVLAGLVKLSSGSLVVDDKVLDDATSDIFVPSFGRSVGMMFQGENLLPFMSVVDNVAYRLKVLGASSQDAKAKATGALSAHGLASLAKLLPRDLSGGQAQRVAIVRTLIAEPNIVLLDEPLSAIDQQSRSDLRKFLREKLTSFVGYKFIVSHNRSDIEQITDREIFIHQEES